MDTFLENIDKNQKYIRYTRLNGEIVPQDIYESGNKLNDEGFYQIGIEITVNDDNTFNVLTKTVENKEHVFNSEFKVDKNKKLISMVRFNAFALGIQEFIDPYYVDGLFTEIENSIEQTKEDYWDVIIPKST